MLGRTRSTIKASSVAALRAPTIAHPLPRFAHAARLPSEDDSPSQPVAGPSRTRGPARASHKGKEREVESEYRFPERGRNGGPPDPYEVLGLARSATDSEIKQTYYRLAMILHPDSSHPSSSPEHFATLHRAYSLLSQPNSRSMFLQTGFGWSPTGAAVRDTWSDAQMRSEVHARRRGGAAAWEAGSRGYRSSEAGRGGAGWAHHQQEQWQYGDEFAPPPKGNGEVVYMSNGRFMSVFTAVCVVIAWIQYQRVGMATESHRELLQAQHQSASQALAEARGDAARYGKERRERIRRRVRELEVMNEVEKLENGEAEAATSYDQ